MTIVVTGGGSGGHITPILAVASELKKLQPNVKIIYIGQRGDSLSDVPAADPNIDEIYAVSAGKFRRYHGEGMRQFLDVRTGLLNARDVFRVLRGYRQSRKLLHRLQPDIIFIKGGFVGVPVGLAAARLKLPFVTHDSDAIPGLANRIIARWAAVHAVALPKEVYHYPAANTVTVGVPVTDKYELVTPAAQQAFRRELKIPDNAQVIFVIGGGLGAQRVNEAVGQALPRLLASFPNLQVIQAVGRANEKAMLALYAEKLTPTEKGRVTVVGFLNDVYRYSGAADIVVTRAGATNLAEFAVQGKACVVVPNPFLTAGHQIKNASYLEQQQAAAVISETELSAEPSRLDDKLEELLQHPEKRQILEKNFAAFGHPTAAHELAMVLLEQVNKHTNNETTQTTS